MLELDALLASVTRGLVDDFGVALARIWLVQPGDATMQLCASSGLSTRLDGTYARVPIGARKIGLIAERREGMWTNDVAHDDRIADHAWALDNGLVAFAGWPLTFRGSLEGVLATFCRRPLTDAERPRMALFAHQAAIAIKNARLFAEVRALEERLQAENAYLRREVAGEDEDGVVRAIGAVVQGDDLLAGETRDGGGRAGFGVIVFDEGAGVEEIIRHQRRSRMTVSESGSPLILIGSSSGSSKSALVSGS